MALSFYTYWQNHDTVFRPPSPSPELLTLHEDSAFYDTNLNLFFDPNYTNNLDIIPLNYSENVSSLISYQEPYYNLPNPTTFFDYETMFPAMVPELHSELPPLPETYQGVGGFTATLPNPWYGYGGGKIEERRGNLQVKKESNGLSAQSLAARVRRRKISDKTQELGRLIPGGHKMNTAEMFQAAFKYIKFLQAQIGVLKFMAPLPESEEILGNGELQALVTCTLMQEKLYTAEKCIVPKYFAETAGDQTP